MKTHANAFAVLGFLAVVLLSSNASACSVPVFRYALENWQPDRLTVAVLHDGEMSPETKRLVEQMEVASTADAEANVQLHPIDVSADHPAGSAEAFHSKQWKDKELPHMLVYFTNDAPEPQLAWSAKLNEQNVDRLLQSPARKQVVERLLDGHTAVWVLLKSGDETADARAEKELLKELKRKPDEIELPTLTDLATEEKFTEGLSVEMRVEFSVISIDPDDEDEVFFREMLLNTESDLRDYKDPIAIPIYGRGRTYFALVGPGISADNIDDNCNFICGACSCEVKRDNPGQDLLLAANWNQIQPGEWVNDTPLPELTGIGGFEALADTDSTPIQESAVDKNVSPEMVSSADASTAGDDDTNAIPEDGVMVAALPRESQSSVAAKPAPETAAQPNSSSDVIAPGILLWGVVLFGVGLVFTIWQRRHSGE